MDASPLARPEAVEGSRRHPGRAEARGPGPPRRRAENLVGLGPRGRGRGQREARGGSGAGEARV